VPLDVSFLPPSSIIPQRKIGSEISTGSESYSNRGDVNDEHTIEPPPIPDLAESDHQRCLVS
jgi:hypothetical protein